MADQLVARIFPLLFTSREPVTEATIAEVLGVSARTAREGLRSLQHRVSGLGLQLSTRRLSLAEGGAADGYFLETAPQAQNDIRRIQKKRPARKLTPYAKKTLLILMRSGRAMTKKEIEELRGPSSGETRKNIDVGPVLKTLIAERLVAEVGRMEDELGRPKVYRATGRAQERFPALNEATQRLLKGREELLPDGGP